MNDATIENLLSRAPKPSPPPELLRLLHTGIALPAAKTAAAKAHEWQSPLRRWFPALAFSVFLLSCAIMIAVQANWSTNLRRQNETLRTATAGLPQLREQHAALEKAQAQQDELARLRKDNEDLHKLQAEAAQLRGLPGEIQRLQAENRRLATSLSAPAPSAGVSANFFDEARQEAERIQCVNNLKQIGLAFRIWAQDNNDKYPTSLVVMSNELSTTKILVCPSDQARLPYASLGFGQFQDNMTSYQFTVQPDDLKYPQCIIAKCPIHRNYLLADGSVQQVNPKKPAYREVQKNGRWYLEPAEPGSTWNDAINPPTK
jgi:hypothetical protein